jgi:Methyltransferase domain
VKRRWEWLGLPALVMLVGGTFAQNPSEEVPFVPTPQPVVEAMLKLAQVRPSDFVMDLGSGDGRIVITAARQYGAEGIGVEYDQTLIDRATKAAAEAGVTDRVSFRKQDIFDTDLSQATVLALYLLPEVNISLRPRIFEQLRPGARVVSHDWDMGDWEPDAKMEVDAPGKEVGAHPKSTIYLWVIPANVAGPWKSRLGAGGELELDLTQKYQHVGGTVRYRNVECPISEATLSGDRIAIRACEGANRLQMIGKAYPDRIVGSVSRGGAPRTQFRALRDKPSAFPSFR